MLSSADVIGWSCVCVCVCMCVCVCVCVCTRPLGWSFSRSYLGDRSPQRQRLVPGSPAASPGPGDETTRVLRVLGVLRGPRGPSGVSRRPRGSAGVLRRVMFREAPAGCWLFVIVAWGMGSPCSGPPLDQRQRDLASDLTPSANPEKQTRCKNPPPTTPPPHHLFYLTYMREHLGSFFSVAETYVEQNR